MVQDLQKSVIRILNVQGATVGAGFVVAKQLMVTCAHVIQAAGSDTGQFVQIQFYANGIQQTAQVLTRGWSACNDDDVAFLELAHLPEGIVPVVLGHLKDCSGHSYSALGFPRLANYEARWAHGELGGVVPVVDKFPMLQCEGHKIKQGMSGAPILDLNTNRVVGMVSEFIVDNQERFAWATTTDTLFAFTPTLRQWPNTYGPDELDTYLRCLIEANQKLTLPDGNEVWLERIYVSLRADEMNAIERRAEHDIYVEDVAAIRQLAEGTATNPYAAFAALRKVVARRPKMLMLEARNWERLFGLRERGSFSLAEVVQRHRYVVLLGDPGSGKTTLGKWLILQFARAFQQQSRAHVLVKADLVSPGTEANQLIDLGPARLPIFIRISDYVRARWNSESGDTGLTLEQFIGQLQSTRAMRSGLTSKALTALAMDYLKQGRALVVLDGLDEVGDPKQRRAVMQAVKKFIQAQPVSSIPSIPVALKTVNDKTQVRTVFEPEPSEVPGEMWGGNRILLTSRIVGYQFDPLTDLPHYTVEDMDEKAIKAFCHAWVMHVASVDEIEEQTEKLKAAIFDYAHPGVRTLAGNPLLLTILAQVYWTNVERTLPARRVALFDSTARALYSQREDFWDRAGIPLLRLTRALGAVAVYIHANEVTGFVEEGTVRARLGSILTDSEQVEVVLEAAREVSGFLVARGEGVYGFLHRSLQEYFAAKYLTDSPEQVAEKLADRLLDSTWREPIVLAVGMVSSRGYPDSQRYLFEAFTTLLNTPDPAGDFLPRRELLAAAACAECERIPQGIGRRIAASLIALYVQRADRSHVLRERIQQAFIFLNNSQVGSEVEMELCAALQDSRFEYRLAALNIIIETKWETQTVAHAVDTMLCEALADSDPEHCYDATRVLLKTGRSSPKITRALVVAWYNHVNVTLLTLLDDIRKFHPEYFQREYLPMRQALETKPQIWEKVKDNQNWLAIITALYLPPHIDLKPKHINRDSPLTPLILSALQQYSSGDYSLVFLQELISFCNQPGTAYSRDAALALSALGEKSWIASYVMNSKREEGHIGSMMSCLAKTIIQFLEHVNNQASILFYSEGDALNLSTSSNLARELKRYLTLAQNAAQDLTQNYNLDNTIDESLVHFLARANACAQDIERGVRGARAKWIKDGERIKNLNSTHTLVLALQRTMNLLVNMGEVWVAFMVACAERWPAKPPFVNSVEPQELTQDILKAVVNDLTASNDARRERSRKLLVTERLASELGKAVIEQMAALAHQYAENRQVGTQLEWALQRVTYDTPFWVAGWIEQVSQAEDIIPSEIILRYMQRATIDTFDTILSALSVTKIRTRRVVLSTISWLGRLGQIPRERWSTGMEQLLSWLNRETDPKTSDAIIEVLGYWPSSQKRIFDILLQLLNDPSRKLNRPRLYMTLAHLASYNPIFRDSVLTVLDEACPQREASAALVRLSLTPLTPRFESEEVISKQNFLPAMESFLRRRQTWDDLGSRCLTRLEETHHDPYQSLTALLDAGIDDDIWDDDYHGVLANVVRTHLERYPDLLPDLLDRLQITLQGQTWSARRITLAAVAACVEVMPAAVQRASLENLEALLIKGTMDTGSHHSRRFALTALSYLHSVTAAVAPALLAGCQDVEVVQLDTIAAVSRFQSIKGNPLPVLNATLSGESASTAYAVAQLLGALGTSLAGEAAGLREQIIEALVKALKDPSSQQEVIISGVSKGKRDDILYTVLLRVAGWL